MILDRIFSPGLRLVFIGIDRLSSGVVSGVGDPPPDPGPVVRGTGGDRHEPGPLAPTPSESAARSRRPAATVSPRLDLRQRPEAPISSSVSTERSTALLGIPPQGPISDWGVPILDTLGHQNPGRPALGSGRRSWPEVQRPPETALGAPLGLLAESRYNAGATGHPIALRGARPGRPTQLTPTGGRPPARASTSSEPYWRPPIRTRTSATTGDPSEGRAFGSTDSRATPLRRPRTPAARSHPGRWWFALLALLGAALPALGQVNPGQPIIREIRLEGLERVSQGEIEAQLQIKVGDPFDPRRIDAEYERLYDTGNFQAIAPPIIDRLPNGVRLTLRFTERPLVSEVRLEGVNHFARGETLQRLQIKRKSLLNAADLRLDRFDLERRYRETGFLFASVTTEVQTDAGETVVIYRIHEGPRVTIDDIRMRGNETFTDDELREVLQTREKSWFFGFPNSGYFDEEQYFTDLEILRTYYRSKGFFDVTVLPEDFSFNRDRDRLYLGIRIVEGPRYTVRSVSVEIEGPGVFPLSLLESKIEIEPGEIYDAEEVAEGQLKIERLYRDHAYIAAVVDIQPVVRLDVNDVGLVFRVREGEKFYVEGINIKGNAETLDKVIRRELRFYPGEEFNFSKIAESRSNLFRLGYFRDVSIYETDGTTANQKDVVIEVEEDESGRFIFGFGVASSRGLVGNIALNKRNFDITDLPESFLDLPDAFTGAGQNFLIEASPGNEFSRYRMAFTEPYLFDTDVSLSLRAFKVDVQRDNYRDDRLGAEVGFGQRFTEYLSGELSLRYEIVDIRDIDADAPPDVFRVRGTTRVSSLRGDLAYDRRSFRPIVGFVDGWMVGGGYEYAGGFMGAELDISKADVRFQVFKTIKSDDDKLRHVISFRNEASWVEEHHNTPEVPIYERYYLGGSRTLRGFRLWGVGPLFNKDPLGGNVRHFGALQYTFPLLEDTLRGLVFVDWGNIDTGVHALRLDKYRVSSGVGLLLSLDFLGQPLPISVSWGEPLLKEDTDRVRNFLFDIGVAF